MIPPWFQMTLRSLRRAMTHGGDHRAYCAAVALWRAEHIPYVVVSTADDKLAHQPEVDALVSRYGAHCTVEELMLMPPAAARPTPRQGAAGESPASSQDDGAHCSSDDPSEVADQSQSQPQPQQENNGHDLDSTSPTAEPGSTDDGAQALSPAVRGHADAGTTGAGGVLEASPPGGESTDQDRSGRGLSSLPSTSPQGDGNHRTGDSAGDGPAPDPSEGAGDPQPLGQVAEGGCITSASLEAHDGIDSGVPWPAVETGGVRRGKPSLTACREFGGLYSDLDVAERLAEQLSNPARRVRRALLRLLGAQDMGSPEDASPRIAWKKLVTELVTRRCALARAQRRELDAPAYAILCDESGSCSASATDTVAAAISIARQDDRVIVVRHSNGQVHDTYGRALRVHGHLPPIESVLPPVRAVIAFGDADALHSYQAIGTERFFWLHSWSARRGGVRPAPRHMQRDHGWPALAGYYVGVNSAETAAVALEHMARQP